jgi:hypothetical protein
MSSHIRRIRLEIRRTRRAQSMYPGESGVARDVSRVRSPSPIRASAKDSSWRDKLGAGEKPSTTETEKPSMFKQMSIMP